MNELANETDAVAAARERANIRERALDKQLAVKEARQKERKRGS